MRPLPGEWKTSSTCWDGELSERADDVQLFDNEGEVDASIFLGDGAGVWGSGIRGESGGQVLVDDGIRLLGKGGRR